MDDFIVIPGQPFRQTGVLKRGTYQACLDFVHATEDPQKPRHLLITPLPSNPHPVKDVDYASLERRMVTYIAGDREFLYPGLGDPKPPGGAKVDLLTTGGVCVSGTWTDDAYYLGWAPLPKRNKAKEAKL